VKSVEDSPYQLQISLQEVRVCCKATASSKDRSVMQKQHKITVFTVITAVKTMGG